MRDELRQSIWARLAAVSFIYLIILGNIWIGLTLGGGEAPIWLFNSFMVGVVAASVTGLGLTLLAAVTFARSYFAPPEDPPEDES